MKNTFFGRPSMVGYYVDIGYVNDLSYYKSVISRCLTVRESTIRNDCVMSGFRKPRHEPSGEREGLYTTATFSTVLHLQLL